MKPKKMNQKLTLNKKTVAHLDSRELDEVRGGNDSRDTCGTWCCIMTIHIVCTKTL